MDRHKRLRKTDAEMQEYQRPHPGRRHSLNRLTIMAKLKGIQISRSGVFELIGANKEIIKEFRSDEELLKALPSFAGIPIYDRRGWNVFKNQENGRILVGRVIDVIFAPPGAVLATVDIDDEKTAEALLNKSKRIETGYFCANVKSDREGCDKEQIDLVVSHCYLVDNPD